jgi:hypothetical protein
MDMERFFAPISQRQEVNRDPGIGATASYTGLIQLELKTERREEILIAGYTWTDFLSFISDKLVWLASNVFVSSNTNQEIWHGNRYRSLLTIQTASESGPATFNLAVWTIWQGNAGHACEWITRLLATSQAPEIRIDSYGGRPLLPVSALTLSSFLSTSKSIRTLCVWMFALSEEHVRALAETDHTNLLVKLTYCDLMSDSETDSTILAELLRASQARLELVSCIMAGDVLAGALKGNSCCVRLTPSRGDEGSDELEIHSLFLALAENEGLVELDMSNQCITDENWAILCRSVRTHPTLEVLDLRFTTNRRGLTCPVRKNRRALALVEILQENTVLHTIRTSHDECCQRVMRESICPSLQINRFRSRVNAVKETPGHMRRQILGRALYAIRRDPNLVSMFLAENIDCVSLPL